MYLSNGIDNTAFGDEEERNTFIKRLFKNEEFMCSLLGKLMLIRFISICLGYSLPVRMFYIKKIEYFKSL